MRAHSQLQMIVWTLVAVLIGAAGVFTSVLQPPSTIKQARALQTQNSTTVEATRAPASEVPQFSALSIDDKGSQAIDFNMPCENTGHFSRNIVQVRLSGSLCGKRKGAIESSEIRNMTNGFSATVFPGDKVDSFTTDYITLANGMNRIRIQHFLKSGEKIEREFVIDRN